MSETQLPDWQPLWLDGGDASLYAAFHAPAPGTSARAAVVLAPPFLNEQWRSRRVQMEAATIFAARGLPVLRFDYASTGDSDERAGGMRLQGMLRDTAVAIGQLRQRTSAKDILLLTWLSSSLLASTASHCGHSRLAMIDPVLDGDVWMREAETRDHDERTSSHRYLFLPTGGEVPADGQLLGRPAADAWCSELRALRWTATTSPAPDFLLARSGQHPLLTSLFPRTNLMTLPDDAPRFSDGVEINRSVIMTPALKAALAEMADAIAEGAAR